MRCRRGCSSLNDDFSVDDIVHDVMMLVLLVIYKMSMQIPQECRYRSSAGCTRDMANYFSHVSIRITQGGSWVQFYPSVSRHDLCLADGLCVQSLVLCERFKWEINIKRPFMAPSNKQLDSSFCFASLLLCMLRQALLDLFLFRIFRGLLKRRLDSTCKSVRLFGFTRIMPRLCWSVAQASSQ